MYSHRSVYACAILALLTLTTACAGDDPSACVSTDECLRAELCSAGVCVPIPRGDDPSQPPAQPGSPGVSQPSAPPHTVQPGSPDAPPEQVADMGAQQPDAGWPEDMVVHQRPGDAPDDAPVDGQTDAPTDASDPNAGCQGRGPTPGELIIHEALANVPGGDAGDANADGARDAYDDEFVELVSRHDGPLDLTGVQVLSGTRVKFTFPSMCLAPRQGVVVFSGPKGLPPEVRPDGVVVFRADTRLSLSNQSGSVTLRAVSGHDLAILSYDEAPTSSYTVWPELVGDSLRPHAEVAPSGALFSPGTCADGSPLVDGCPAPAATQAPAGDDPGAGQGGGT